MTGATLVIRSSVVRAGLGLGRADHLPGADVRVVELGMPLDGEHAKERPPEVADQVHLDFVSG